jgi:hypothetical protein
MKTVEEMAEGGERRESIISVLSHSFLEKKMNYSRTKEKESFFTFVSK